MPNQIDPDLVSVNRLVIHLVEDSSFEFPDGDEISSDKEAVILYQPASDKPAILPVADSHQATLGDIAIFEWTNYLLKGKALQQVHLGGTALNALDEGLYSFRLQNQVGQLRLKLLNNGSWYHLPLAVLSHKYPTPQAHLDFFNTLLEDLIQQSAALPFHISQTTAFAADESPEPPTVLFVYHFLRQYGQKIQSALETILGNPHRSLIYEDELVTLARVTDVDSSMLENIVSQPQFLTRTAENIPIAQALHGYAPSHLWQRQAEETLDTPPNRFTKQFLMELADWSTRLDEAQWLVNHPSSPLSRLATIRDELAFAQFDPLWQEVGPLTRFPAENQVLLKRYGYREWTQLWRQFHQARLPVFRQLEEAIDARDVGTLYEVWCFFALVDQIRKTLEIDPGLLIWSLDLSDEKGLEYTTKVTFGQTGYILRYNEGFNRSRTRSYSIRLRPDFTLHGPNNLRLLFDAKFRFDIDTFSAEDVPEKEDVQRTAKKADLYKMHTYRDALRAQVAVALYPGNEDIFYRVDDPDSKAFSWKPVIEGEWTGIGAVSVTPTG